MTSTSRLRRITAALLPFLLIAAAFPAFGFLGIGDAAIVANQVIQIAAQVTQVAEAVETVLSLEDQLDQQIAEALGQVGALVESFDQLTSDPMSLLSDFTSLSWGTDFTGDPRQLLQNFANMQDPNANPLTDYWRQYLAQADTISRQRYANTFGDVAGASDKWLAQRELADRARIFDYTALDSAERIIELLGTASDTVERSRTQTNLSDTALAQEQFANQITVAEIDMAVAELLAQTAVRDAMDRQTLELERREQLEAWVVAERAQARQADRAQNRIRGQRNAWRQAFLLD